MECTIGGTRRHLGDISRGLLARGWEVHLAVSAERTQGFRTDLAQLAEAGAHVHEVPMVRELDLAKDRAHAQELFSLIQELEPDLIHTHSSKAGALGRRAARKAGCEAVVHTPHTYSFLFGHMFGPLKRWIFKAVERRLSRMARLIVAVSEGEAATMRSSGVVDPTQVRVVSNGIDPAPYELAAPAALEESEGGRLRVLVCGLLNVAKGQDLAISALALPGCEEVELWIAGEGEERRSLEGLAASLGVAERVVFLGHREDVPSLMKAADLLLLPSRWEGMPYVVLEAAAAGLPVLGTPVDGARELLCDGERGWMASEPSAEAVGAALKEVVLAGEGERSARAERAQAWVLERHALERMMDDLEAVYEELL
ncbi:MAG: glycosyltransferase [Planctomycetes bacterium]|nr:glycosyltransferase [Planctomycetota bacterium]